MEHLQNIVGAENVYHDEALKKHTTFRIGGPARYFVTPRYIEDFVETIHYLQTKEYPYLILGNGSNFLFQDEGYSGVVVSTRGTGKTAKVKDKIVLTESAKLCTQLNADGVLLDLSKSEIASLKSLR